MTAIRVFDTDSGVFGHIQHRTSRESGERLLFNIHSMLLKLGLNSGRVMNYLFTGRYIFLGCTWLMQERIII